MRTYAAALALMSPWGRLKMRCISVGIWLEAYLLPRRSRARAMRMARGEER